MTLRARLFLALLALALIPTAIFALFALDQLGRATDHWVRPGVSRALDAGVEVSKSALARLDAIAISAADAWAEEWRASGPAGPSRAALRARLPREGLDYLHLYAREGGRWRIVERLTPAGLLDLGRTDFSATLPDTLPVPAILHGEEGSLAAAAPVGETQALVIGWWMSPGFFPGIDQVTEGASNYRQLGLLVALQRNYVWLLVAGLTVALLIGAWFVSDRLAHEMSRPLADLSGALERVAQDDLDTRVAPAGARELRSLGEGFNAMAARLAASRSAERSAREAERNAERATREAERRADLEALEAERQIQRETGWREVARHLAHEIKNPLTAMRYALHRIQKRVDAVPAGEREAVATSVNAILREVGDLSAMAEQFAQYARKPEPQLAAVDLAALARDAAALQEPDCLKLELRAPVLAVRGDRVLLSRALQNLIVNAREAGKDGAVIEMVARAEDGRAVVEVMDRGSGLPAGPAERLFAPYVSTKNRGSGVGLSLVRDVAVEHHGGVTLENREGGGAIARLWLPLARQENQETPPA